MEYLLIMGIRNFPYRVLETTSPNSIRVSRRAVKRMAGNGMHAAAIGTMFIFALASCSWADQEVASVQ